MPHATAQALRRTAILSGLSFAAVASARVLLKPRPIKPGTQMLEWERVRSAAHIRTGESGRLRDDAEQAAKYDAMARELAPHMAEVLGEIPSHFPVFQSIDRRGFIDRNLVIVQRMVGPVEELRQQLPESRLSELSRGVTSRYVGQLFGFLSHRVLGQYDPVMQLGPPAVGDSLTSSLFLVEPNVATFQRTQDVPGDQLRRWLILHELTHAWQFESHPWLRDYLTGLMNEMLSSGLMQDPDTAGATYKPPKAQEMARRLPETVRVQLRGLGRVQAAMSVLEGYSNFVMNRVGAAHLEQFDKLEAAFHKRQRQRTLLEKIVMTVTGMRMKMRQYEVGEKFSAAVTKRAGLETLNLVWSGPEALPTMQELRQPELWISRVG